MPADAPNTYIHYPRNLAELINLYHRRPHALLYAGGNYILKTRRERYPAFGTDVIYIGEVPELRRINRSERTVEIGAAVPVAEILELGRNVMPGPFLQALRRVGPVGVTHTATLGGNLGVPDEVLTVHPVLQLLDARIELRRHGNSRWLPINRLRDGDGSLALQLGELISRIRVPVNVWNHAAFFQFGKPYLQDSEPLVFSALARTSKEVVEDLRVAAGAGGAPVFRNRELEAELVGRRFPFPQRELQAFLRNALDYISSVRTPLTGMQRHRMISLLRDFVMSLQRPD